MRGFPDSGQIFTYTLLYHSRPGMSRLNWTKINICDIISLFGIAAYIHIAYIHIKKENLR